MVILAETCESARWSAVCLLQWVVAAAADAALDDAKEEDLSWTRLTVKCITGLITLKQKWLSIRASMCIIL